MINDVCLMIIYNHRYDANIEKLEKIYGARFSNIYHIVPFYNGDKNNVITVYECSFRFEGYIAQAINLMKEEYKQYFFTADDIILNPEINEINYQKWFGVNDNQAFITFSKSIYEMQEWTLNSRTMDPLPKFEFYNGTIWEHEIMPAQEAFEIAKKKGYSRDDFCVDLKMVWKARKKLRKYPRLFVLFFKILLMGKQYCPYPVWGGYSDLIIIPRKEIKEFSHMLGVFAAMGLHVELAIPTAMNLMCKEMVQEKDLRTKASILWSNEERENIEKMYERKYKVLVEKWQDNCLYIHPVKLSRWGI